MPKKRMVKHLSGERIRVDYIYVYKEYIKLAPKLKFDNKEYAANEFLNLKEWLY